jgi:nucleoside-diphosphate-sugar epimerase
LTTGPEEVGRLLDALRPDAVVHLAGRLDGTEADLVRSNEQATANLLEAVRRLRPSLRVVVASSTAVYGRGGSPDQPVEESHLLEPTAAYGRSKRAAEAQALAHAARGGAIRIARISNPVGSGMSRTLVCGSLAWQVAAIERREMEPRLRLRDVSPLRDFVHADDCVRALFLLLQAGEAGQAYNVARGVSVSIAEVVSLLLDLARVRPIEVVSEAGTGERSPLSAQWVSNARLRGLGWEPRHDLRQALLDLLRAERERPQVPIEARP